MDATLIIKEWVITLVFTAFMAGLLYLLFKLVEIAKDELSQAMEKDPNLAELVDFVRLHILSAKDRFAEGEGVKKRDFVVDEAVKFAQSKGIQIDREQIENITRGAYQATLGKDKK